MTRGWTRAPTDRERKTCGPSVKICRVGALPGDMRRAAKLPRLRPRTCGKFKGGLGGCYGPWSVMAALVPAIHVLTRGSKGRGCPGRLARRRVEPVTGPRFARTRWRFCPGMAANLTLR